MSLINKLEKYKYKLENCLDNDKKNVYKSKYMQYQRIITQQGSGIFDIENFHSKRNVCAKKSFDNKEIINEIYFNDLLNELDSQINSLPEQNQKTTEYSTISSQLTSLIKSITGRIKGDNTDFNMETKPLTLVSYIKKVNNFPPKLLQYIKDSEKTKIKSLISDYETKLLDIDNIGYLMCSTLYDKYMSAQRILDSDTKIFRYVLKQTIKRFDSDADIIDNFKFFHRYFADTFKTLSVNLNTCYLNRGNYHNYLILAKTKSGIKNVLDISKEENIYLKNICDSYLGSGSDLSKLEKELDHSTTNSDINERIKKVNSEITELELEQKSFLEKVSELTKKRENYEKKLAGTIEEYQKMTEQEKYTPTDYKDWEWNQNMVKNYNGYIDNKKKQRDELQKEKSNIHMKNKMNQIEYYKQFFLTKEHEEEYMDKITKCIHNNKNILVPISLMNLTSKDKIDNIQQHLLSKDNLSARLELHANMLFINTEKKYIEHFEPHGVSALYDSTEVSKVLEKIHLTIPILKSYKFYKQSETCPILYGPQSLDRSSYCYIHSGYYALLRILYPDIKSEELQTMLISQTNEGFKDQDDPSQDKTSLDYLNKKYTPLSGEKIKSRLENFMKWHRYIVDFMKSPQHNIVEQFLKIIKEIVPPLKFD